MSPNRKWFVLGASGLLGVRFVDRLLAHGRVPVAQHNSNPLPSSLDAFGLQLDLLSGVSIEQMFRDTGPDVVVNCAGLTDVDRCEQEPAEAARLNTTLAGQIAAAARAVNAQFVQISTDHLWSGAQSMVDEDHPTEPINVYAETKSAGEAAVRAVDPAALIIRTNFFGPSLPWRRSFQDWLTVELNEGRPVTAFSDVFFTPIASDLLSDIIIELVDRNAQEILHVAGSERISKCDFAFRYAERAKLNTATLRPGSVQDVSLRAPRPRDMSLDCSRASAILGRNMPSLDDSFAALELATAFKRT